MAVCEFSGLDTRSCSHCLGQLAGRRLSGQLPASTRTMAARYDSRCPGCGGPIREGSTIGLVDDAWCCPACFEGVR